MREKGRREGEEGEEGKREGRMREGGTNRRRACAARVTALGLCVCMCVCLLQSAASRI